MDRTGEVTAGILRTVGETWLVFLNLKLLILRKKIHKHIFHWYFYSQKKIHKYTPLKLNLRISSLEISNLMFRNARHVFHTGQPVSFAGQHLWFLIIRNKVILSMLFLPDDRTLHACGK